jgi:hypothetical protein
MICVQLAKKLFFKRSDCERARATLLQLYTSSGLQRNGNNHMFMKQLPNLFYEHISLAVIAQIEEVRAKLRAKLCFVE